jgi:hypothetical protein
MNGLLVLLTSIWKIHAQVALPSKNVIAMISRPLRIALLPELRGRVTCCRSASPVAVTGGVLVNPAPPWAVSLVAVTGGVLVNPASPWAVSLVAFAGGVLVNPASAWAVSLVAVTGGVLANPASPWAVSVVAFTGGVLVVNSSRILDGGSELALRAAPHPGQNAKSASHKKPQARQRVGWRCPHRGQKAKLVDSS